MYNNNSTTIEHPEFTLPKPDPAQVPGGHPFNNPKNHQELLEYIQCRLQTAKEVRDGRLERMAQIDRDVAGWIKLSDEEKKRQVEYQRTGKPQGISVNLPLSYVQIDDMMTYFAQTFSPTRGMFYHSGTPDESQQSVQITTLMNNHAIYDGYFRKVLMAIFNILKYNEGGFFGRWDTDKGPKMDTTTNNEATVKTEQTIWSGNRIEALDPYNTFVDPSVDATQVYKDGEFAARAYLKSHFWLQREALRGRYFNLEQALKEDSGVAECAYYRSPPAESMLYISDGTTSGSTSTNWKSILAGSPMYMKQTGFEVVECYINLNPYQFGLIPRNALTAATRNQYEMWRITICNDKFIIGADRVEDMHGYLPFFFGRINDDSMQGDQRSVAEIIQPLGNFASFLMNAHMIATRKNIFGLTIYDPSMIDLDKIPEGEVAARVPLKASGWGKDVRTAIWEHQQTLDTKQTLQDLQGVMTLINQFFPASAMPSQVASIDRAVSSQVAAVQQGVNRRQQKAARLLDDVLFRPLRFMMYYNIVQYQTDGEEVSDFRGKPVKIDMTQIRATNLPFIIGQGLKSIDRQASAESMKEIIFAIIQNPAVAQQLDLLGMIDFWTSMIDVDVDMTQFHLQQQPAAQVGPDGQPIPGGGAPPQAGNGVQPIVDPSQIGRPLQNGVRA